VRDYPGNYTQYRLAREEARKEVAETAASPSAPVPASAPRGDYSKRLSFKEKFEYDSLPDRIATLESEKKQLAEALGRAEDHTELLRLSDQLGTVSEALDAAEMRWLELAERAGG
jgi:ATP-binding cassette subfamily F protein uup